MATNFSIYKNIIIFFLIIILTDAYCNSKPDCNAAVKWQMDFNEVASASMEGIVNFNNTVTFILVFIMIFVCWVMTNCVYFYMENNNSNISRFTHSNELEVIWTSVPAIILLFLATPSFSLLYSMDEIADPTITLKIIGHQWYWSYEFSDYNYLCSDNNMDTKIKYNCYMTDLETMSDKKGYFRLLETNKRILLPIKTHIRLLVSAADVLHSWTVPSFGVKVDACPGRLNQINLFIKRTGLFFGQCSEICGVNHAFMPISVVGVEQKIYSIFLYEQMVKYL